MAGGQQVAVEPPAGNHTP